MNPENPSKEHSCKEHKENEERLPQSVLKDVYTFDNFIVGKSNWYAYTLAKGLCEKSVKIYNPLYIYSDIGLGKTHLLQAVGHAFFDKGESVVYVSAEVFMNDFADHLRSQTMDRFRDRYRNVDLLLIDDIHYLHHKEQIQEELMHTLEVRQNSRKQTLLSADRSPVELSGVHGRLRSLFLQGIVVEIEPNEKEMRTEIIRKKCNIVEVDLDAEIVDFIASFEEITPREIEGVIIKLYALTLMLDRKMTLTWAQEALAGYLMDDVTWTEEALEYLVDEDE